MFYDKEKHKESTKKRVLLTLTHEQLYALQALTADTGIKKHATRIMYILEDYKRIKDQCPELDFKDL